MSSTRADRGKVVSSCSNLRCIVMHRGDGQSSWPELVSSQGACTRSAKLGYWDPSTTRIHS